MCIRDSIIPQSELVYFPRISELKKFPILTNAPPIAIGIVSLSKIQKKFLNLYFFMNKYKPIKTPIAAP